MKEKGEWYIEKEWKEIDIKKIRKKKYKKKKKGKEERLIKKELREWEYESE